MYEIQYFVQIVSKIYHLEQNASFWNKHSLQDSLYQRGSIVARVWNAVFQTEYVQNAVFRTKYVPNAFCVCPKWILSTNYVQNAEFWMVCIKIVAFLTESVQIAAFQWSVSKIGISDKLRPNCKLSTTGPKYSILDNASKM